MPDLQTWFSDRSKIERALLTALALVLIMTVGIEIGRQMAHLTGVARP